jgi:serine/threonine protein kinase
MGARYCLECGSSLPDILTGGLCSACALRGALKAGVEMKQLEESGSGAEPPADAAPLASGQKVGDYEILEEISRGGMGVVYRARQISLDRVVAVKMLLPGLSSPEYLRRFRFEASTAAALQHPNIVAIHEVGVWQGRQYLVMDFVAGRSLALRVADMRGEARDFKKIARWVASIADAIQYAHDRGILHRDLKPSNVLIGDDDRPRVSDFGLAKHVGGESEITLSGHALGSPSFMPPEQAGSRDKVSRRSDVYGLGSTLYYALTGRAPFKGENPAEVLHEVLTLDPVPLRNLDPTIPRDLETICLKCLEKESARRYASARMVAEELSRFLEDKPILERPVKVPEKIWRWCHRKPIVAGLVAVLAVSIGLGGWFGWQSRQSSRHLEQERMRAAIHAALAAAWGGDTEAALKEIEVAEQHGAANEWVPMLRGQIALYSPQTAKSVEEFKRAVTLAPRSVAARAMLATAYLYIGHFDQYMENLESLGELSPETPEDYLFLGAALVGTNSDTARTVSFLDLAKNKLPSGVTFLQLALAEGFHAANIGSWEIAQKALRHCKTAEEILGAEHFAARCVRLNACNFAMRLCPEEERASMRSTAAQAAGALESAKSPIACMQRAFYFGIIGDKEAELREWSKIVQPGVGGIYISYYSAAMLRRDKSGQALEILGQLKLAADGLGAISQAFLLLDKNRPWEARELYPRAAANKNLRALAETIPLLAGDSGRVTADAVQSLDTVAPLHPDYQALQFYAGQISAEELAIRARSSKYQACGDNYLIAMLYLARGEREAARQYFRRSVETGHHLLTQYQWSQAFLARLERDPYWPPWIPNRKAN